MANIYRKAALDKLSSPEQLDKAVTIISPSFWIAAIGGGVIVVAALIWSVFGRLPINVETSGVFMDVQGMGNVVTEQTGIVSEVCVGEGDAVEKGQELLRLDTKDIDEELADLEKRRDAVDAVTFDSGQDVITADNRELVQIKAQKAAAGETSGNADLKTRFISAKANALDRIDLEIADLQQIRDGYTIRSGVNGIVVGMNAAPGTVLQAGAVVCHVSAEGNSNAVISYVPATEGRKLKEGMQTIIYPSTVNRQEYGHMEGVVTYVSSYVSSYEEMVNQLGDDATVQIFQQSGPVIKIICEPTPDPATVSGYKWSNKKGSKVELIQGTIVQMDVVTDRKAPITMIIPFLKEKLSVAKDEP
ncbi:MAG: HlyD family efflux transporter periplasmic adaptor subunit [Oscillospiraceae bacterium]|nr:HlyD family efflux transporter periplasmic adaptor subunit [Oscillospiraceae bacterium]